MADIDRPIYLVDILAQIRQHWIIILAVTLLGGIVAGLIAFAMQPIYRAEVLVAPVESQQSPGALSGMGGSLDLFATFLGGGSLTSRSTAESIATLGSRALSEEFITELGLIPVLFEDSWDSESGSWNVNEDEVPTLGAAFRFFDEEIRSIDLDPTSELVLLSIEWKDPILAAQWANTLIEMANQRLRAVAIDEATKATEYLRGELKNTDIIEVRQAIFAVMETQMQEIMLANVHEQYAFKIIDPAVIAEADDFVRPERLLIIIIGIIVGFIGASTIVVSKHLRR
jgi:uncharacterized protein involved in exopolysaccharide biosynthesis